MGPSSGECQRAHQQATIPCVWDSPATSGDSQAVRVCNDRGRGRAAPPLIVFTATMVHLEECKKHRKQATALECRGRYTDTCATAYLLTQL